MKMDSSGWFVIIETPFNLWSINHSETKFGHQNWSRISKLWFQLQKKKKKKKKKNYELKEAVIFKT